MQQVLNYDKTRKNTSRTSLEDRNEGRLFSSISFLQLLRNEAFPAPSRFHVFNSAPPKKHIYMYNCLGRSARRRVTTSPRNRNEKVRPKLHVKHLPFLAILVSLGHVGLGFCIFGFFFCFFIVNRLKSPMNFFTIFEIEKKSQLSASVDTSHNHIQKQKQRWQLATF